MYTYLPVHSHIFHVSSAACVAETRRKVMAEVYVALLSITRVFSLTKYGGLYVNRLSPDHINELRKYSTFMQKHHFLFTFHFIYINLNHPMPKLNAHGYLKKTRIKRRGCVTPDINYVTFSILSIMLHITNTPHSMPKY